MAWSKRTDCCGLLPDRTVTVVADCCRRATLNKDQTGIQEWRVQSEAAAASALWSLPHPCYTVSHITRHCRFPQRLLHFRSGLYCHFKGPQPFRSVLASCLWIRDHTGVQRVSKSTTGHRTRTPEGPKRHNHASSAAMDQRWGICWALSEPTLLSATHLIRIN